MFVLCVFTITLQVSKFYPYEKNNLPEDYKLRDATRSIASSEGMLPVSLEYPVKA